MNREVMESCSRLANAITAHTGMPSLVLLGDEQRAPNGHIYSGVIFASTEAFNERMTEAAIHTLAESLVQFIATKNCDCDVCAAMTARMKAVLAILEPPRTKDLDS